MTNVAELLAITGAAGLIYAWIATLRARRQQDYKPVLEDWLWHSVLPVIAYGSLIAAGACLTAMPHVALFTVAAVALLLVFIGIHNAWDTVTYITFKAADSLREKNQ